MAGLRESSDNNWQVLRMRVSVNYPADPPVLLFSFDDSGSNGDVTPQVGV